MPFNLDRFDAAQLQRRTATVDLPGLAQFFDPVESDDGDDQNPGYAWTVQNLTAHELSDANDASKKQKEIRNIVKAIAENDAQVAVMRNALGLGDTTPAELAKRITMLVHGSVKPEVTHAQAAKLAEHFPIEFFQLTNEISLLTGLGAELVKPDAASLETAA